MSVATFRFHCLDTYGVEEEGNLGGEMNEILVPEVILGVTEEFDEGDQGTPRVRPINKETFQEDSRHHFPETIDLDFVEQVQHQGAEPVGVSVGVTQMQNHCAEEMMLPYRNNKVSLDRSYYIVAAHTFCVKVAGKILQSNSPGIAGNKEDAAAASLGLGDGGDTDIHNQRIDQGKVVCLR